MTTNMSKYEGNLDFSVHDPFKKRAIQRDFWDDENCGLHTRIDPD